MDLTALLPFSIWLVVKIFFVVGIAIYLIFSLVVVKQVALMTSTVNMGFEFPVKILAYLHLIFAIVVLLLALIIL